LGREDLLKGSDRRQKELQLTKCFTCDCSYCRLDTSRAFRCAKCGSLAAYFKEDGVEGIACQSEGCGARASGEAAKEPFATEAEWVQKVEELPEQLSRRHAGDPRSAFEEVEGLVAASASALHGQHWAANFWELLLRDFHQHVLKSPPSQSVAGFERILSYTQAVYPGVSFCAAMAHFQLAEQCVKAVAPQRPDYALLLQAREHFSVSTRMMEICVGPQYELTQQARTSLEKIEKALAYKCASEGCIKPHDKMCAGCKKVGYCSTECQTADWKRRHKRVCKKK